MWGLAVVLLVLFPILLMYNTRVAGVALVIAIVLLYRGKTSTNRNEHHCRPPDNASI